MISCIHQTQVSVHSTLKTNAPCFPKMSVHMHQTSGRQRRPNLHVFVLVQPSDMDRRTPSVTDSRHGPMKTAVRNSCQVSVLTQLGHTLPLSRLITCHVTQDKQMEMRVQEHETANNLAPPSDCVSPKCESSHIRRYRTGDYEKCRLGFDTLQSGIAVL